MRWSLCVLLLFAVVGCARATFTPRDGAEAQFKRDDHECDSQARHAPELPASGYGGLTRLAEIFGTMSERNSVYARCMDAKGYGKER